MPGVAGQLQVLRIDYLSVLRLNMLLPMVPKTIIRVQSCNILGPGIQNSHQESYYAGIHDHEMNINFKMTSREREQFHLGAYPPISVTSMARGSLIRIRILQYSLKKAA